MTTAKYRALAATTLIVAASVSVVHSHQKRDVAPTREQMRTLLAQGHENRAKWRQTKDDTAKEAWDAELRPILGPARLGFQEIPAGRGDQVRFARVVLNSAGGGFDCVRFRTPATGETFDLLWEIVVPGSDQTRNLQGWGVVGVDGPSPAVTYWSRRDSFELPGVGLPEENYCVTNDMGGQRLRPGSEYILWFDLIHDQPTPAFVKVALTPAEPMPLPRSTTAQKARGTFQNSLKALNQRYDAESKALRKTYLAELDKGAKAAAQKKDAAEADRAIAEADEIARGDAEAANRRGFRILRAQFGVDQRWVDVTDELRPLVRGNVLRFGPGIDMNFKNDPAYGVLKSLIIVYSLDGNTGVSITWEKQRVELPPTGPSRDRIPTTNSYKP